MDTMAVRGGVAAVFTAVSLIEIHKGHLNEYVLS